MVKVGGLADVVAALSKALRLLGHKVTIALPRYPGDRRRRPDAGAAPHPHHLRPPGHAHRDDRSSTAATAPASSFLLLDAAGPDGNALFDRPGVYGEDGEVDLRSTTTAASASSARRVAEFVRQPRRGWAPFDIVHAHDRPAAPSSALPPPRARRRPRRQDPHRAHPAQPRPPGRLPPRGAGACSAWAPSTSPSTGSSSTARSTTPQGRHPRGRPAITAVSTTYAREILTPSWATASTAALAAARRAISSASPTASTTWSTTP